MGKISVFNYEAYYLDFLEGNLNGEDTALFLEFLEANPDLKMDNDVLPSYSEESIILDSETKEKLKHHTEDEVIVSTNIEHFLIAQAEGILSEEKTEEVDKYVAKNNGLTKEKAVFNAVYFKADTSIVFADKQSLRRRKIIFAPSWRLMPYYAAAASVILILLVWYSNTDIEITQKQYFTEDNKKTIPGNKEEPFSLEDNVAKNETQVEGNRHDYISTPLDEQLDNSLTIANHSPIDDRDKKQNNNSSNVAENTEKEPIKKREYKKKSGVNSLENFELQPTVGEQTMATIEPKNEQNNDYASVHFGDVQNPIEQITSFIAKKTKTTVDYRRQKKTKTKPSSIFVKIGKFEFSRKKH
ncbi:MAG: hypothetical protein COA33_006265 [Fluviicola sp.]|nr:hypothetical protein [Fluviicola sp.]